MWQGSAISSDRLLDLCRAVVDQTAVPVVLIAGQTGISAKDAAVVGARGILFDGE
jgi:molybdopterin biosynthesis enzyme MoaB